MKNIFTDGLPELQSHRAGSCGDYFVLFSEIEDRALCGLPMLKFLLLGRDSLGSS